MIPAGRLNRRVRILRRNVVQEGTYGTNEASWTKVADVWAEVQDMLPSRADRLAGELVLTNRPARVRLRWRDDVSMANRIELANPTGEPFPGRPMRIASEPAMFGRRPREDMEIMVETISTEGQQP
jgi:head-tail adaptor